MHLTDESKMIFGKHRGEKLVDVPDEYLLGVWKDNKEDYNDGKIGYKPKAKLMDYIKDNLDAIKNNLE